MAIRARGNVVVDDTIFLAHIQDYATVMGKETSTVIRQQAGLFCKDMVGYTRPFASKSSGGTGGTIAAKKVGFDNVTNSARKIFQPIEHATSQQIASIGDYDVFKAWGERNNRLGPASGRKIRWVQFQAKYGNQGTPTKYFPRGSIDAMDNFMRQYRLDGGRGGLKTSAKEAEHSFAIVQDEDELNKYIKFKQKDVGLLKSAYWFAAQRIGAKITVPAWAKNKNAAGNAIAIDKSQQKQTPEITVGNVIGNKLGNESWTKAAINQRALKMRAQMANYMNKNSVVIWKATNTASYFNLWLRYTEFVPSLSNRY